MGMTKKKARRFVERNQVRVIRERMMGTIKPSLDWKYREAKKTLGKED